MKRFVSLICLSLLFGCTSQDDAPGPPGVPAAETGTARPSRSASGRIEVTQPTRGQRVRETFSIAGRAQIFENRVSFRLRTGKNTILATGTAMVDAPDSGAFGPFRGELAWHGVPAGTAAELEVFAVRPRDGAPDHVVTIPLVLEPSGTK